MHPYISQMVAAERTRDMQQRAAAARRGRAARASGPGRAWFGRTESRRAMTAPAARQSGGSQHTTAAARS
jgi:hypothetical protein